MRALTKLLAVLLASSLAVSAQSNQPDLTKDPTLYVVAYSHLDTQWRWEYPRVINEYIPKTLHDNFALLDKYPNYVFNFSGANRYRMMKEYWPADYARLKTYVAAGRWFPAGSSMEEGDVNAPSAESIFRQILYGNRFFQREFGKTSAEYMLPDCFGFPASLPSILAHAGLKGFSTQKLTWNSAANVGGRGSIEETPRGIPWNVGWWAGPDGRGIVAALNPGSYGGQIREDISKSPPAVPNAGSNLVDWPARVERNGKVSGLFTDYHYYGTGDTGGAPREDSVRMMESIVTKNDGPLKVVSATAEQMFLNIRPEHIKNLPRYEGDLLLTDHSAGSITSQAYQKRWNRKNELLADAAEKASVGAMWLGSRVYPHERLNNAWTLVMGGQFHDILPGTATPRAFQFSWNDDVIAMNQFAGVLTDATEGISAALDTQARGQAIVVYNPLNIFREDVVEASVSGEATVRVVGPGGVVVPSQRQGGKVLFLAKVPSVGYAVYDVQSVPSVREESTLKVSQSSLENHRYRIRLNSAGDVTSIFDKQLNRELLEAPLRLAIKNDTPAQWPAWNMDWTDQQKPPRGYVSGPAQIRVVEDGPVRVGVEVVRQTEGSTFRQTIRLSEGDAGNRVEFSDVIDWHTSNANLKATFALTAANPNATYNWDIGSIARGNNDERKFEVPSHQWFDLTDRSGTFGVTILTDCKYGSDKPDDKTLRLTLLRTPGIAPRAGYADQSSQDWGRHEIHYGLASHAGDWRRAQTDWHAQRLNQPLIAFESSKHAGRLGKTFSILSIGNNRVRVLALKRAEEDRDEIIVRIVELDGREARNVWLAFPTQVIAAREVNAQELPVGKVTVTKGELVTTLAPYQPRTFAVKLAKPSVPLFQPRTQPITLQYDLAVSNRDGERLRAGIDGEGFALPAEMLPQTIPYGGATFSMGPNDKANALVARGQTLPVPQGMSRLYILAASVSGDQNVAFRVGNNSVNLTIQDWSGFIGQWDNREWRASVKELKPRTPPPDIPPDIAALLQRSRTRSDPYGEVASITPGFIKRAPVAWFASHRHTPDGKNEAYAYSYLFAYTLDVPTGAKTLTLPNNDNVRIMAITGSNERTRITPAQPLYDTLERNP